MLGDPSSTENSLLFDSDTMLLRSSVTKLEDEAGVVVVVVVVVVLVERTVVVVVALIVVLAVVVLVVVVEALVVPFLVSFVTSLDEIEMELGGRETTVASVLS